jgi:hypothetical protein
MFKSQQYRADAAEYGELVKDSAGPAKAANFGNCRTVSSRLRITSRGWRTIMTKQYSLQSRTDLAALSLQARKNTFCGALARPSSCNGTLCRRRCSGRSSTPLDRSASYWRRRHSAGRSLDFFTSTRMMPVATNADRRRASRCEIERRGFVAMENEAQFADRSRSIFNPANLPNSGSFFRAKPPSAKPG